MKNGSKMRAARRRVHADAGVGHREHDVRARARRPRWLAAYVVVELDVARLDGELAAARHRVARVDDEVHDHLLELAGIGQHARQRSGCERRVSSMSSPISRRSILSMPATIVVEVEQLRLAASAGG